MAANMACVLSVLLHPYMPHTSDVIQQQLDVTGRQSKRLPRRRRVDAGWPPVADAVTHDGRVVLAVLVATMLAQVRVEVRTVRTPQTCVVLLRRVRQHVAFHLQRQQMPQ